MENPLNDPDGETAYILWLIDISCTAVFTLEAILKIVALGAFSCGPLSYF